VPTYNENSQDDADGRMILSDNSILVFTKYPEALIFVEDSGNIGCKPRFRRNARKV
jgi:hypothetical protein